MEMDFTLLWVLIIVLIGVAISIYSMCKGCAGIQAAERGITARTLVAPYSSMIQQLRAEEAARSRLFVISGQSVLDKDPPSYDELFAPPPSYEDTIRNLQEMKASTSKDGSSSSSQGHDNPAVVIEVEDKAAASSSSGKTMANIPDEPAPAYEECCAQLPRPVVNT